MDCIWWIPSKRKLFEVRSFFRVLNSFVERDEEGSYLFPWKSIWKVKVLVIVNFFAWTAALGWILTVDNFQKRGLIVVDWCSICKWSGESIDHLLLHCDLAHALWSVLFSLFDVKWAMNGRVIDLLACWKGQKGNKMVLEVWRMAPL